MAGEAQIEAFLAALYQRLSGDAALAAMATGGVHLQDAPQNAEGPIVVYRVRPGGRIVGTLGQARAIRYINVEVLAFVDGTGGVTALRMDERFDALLNDYLPALASPWSVTFCRRELDAKASVVIAGKPRDGIGGLYRVGLSGG